MPEPPAPLATPRLLLRRPLPSDASALHDLARDAEVGRFLDWRAPCDVAEAAAFLARCARQWRTGEDYTWIVTLEPDPAAIGAVACRIRDGSAQVGYVLHRAHRGRGLATEAVRALVAWLEGHGGVQRIAATCDAANRASVRVLEKAGFALEGRAPRGRLAFSRAVQRR